MTLRIGFIGLGMMGHGIAKNILKSGYPLAVMAHKKRAALENLLALGAVETTSLTTMVQSADILFFCVTGAKEVEQLVYSDQGVLDSCRAGFILVDCTTSNPALSRRIAQDLSTKGAHFVDAPVTRAPKDAEAGRLNSLVGAERPIFEKIKPLLSCYSENIAYFGLPGSGHSAKLINNFISCGYTALIAEGFFPLFSSRG